MSIFQHTNNAKDVSLSSARIPEDYPNIPPPSLPPEVPPPINEPDGLPKPPSPQPPDILDKG